MSRMQARVGRKKQDRGSRNGKGNEKRKRRREREREKKKGAESRKRKEGGGNEKGRVEEMGEGNDKRQ